MLQLNRWIVRFLTLIIWLTYKIWWHSRKMIGSLYVKGKHFSIILSNTVQYLKSNHAMETDNAFWHWDPDIKMNWTLIGNAIWNVNQINLPQKTRSHSEKHNQFCVPKIESIPVKLDQMNELSFSPTLPANNSLWKQLGHHDKPWTDL